MASLATRAVVRTVRPHLLRTPTRVLSTSAIRNADKTVAPGESDILIEQRKRRPVSPHLSIYQPQLTWYASGVHRITGVAVAGVLYAGSLAYLGAPALGMQFDTQTLVAAVASLPVAAKVGLKTALALPFTFHSLNGLRHLMWDTGVGLSLKGVYTSGYAVLGATVLSTLYLASL
ncbi:hypothetical protein BZG36_02613 [Bifiguratus adelaidae]|uniref:Succinate dehydrogenase cytochrome B subunit, mitochondrial n=1 Tax=Bifiguratus adelaidae TaxID=1938954 RepID=A0A261Y2M8_9FUNG|nr:hypothetical protein BZG36_02613 [Bifiguratus adelaidae]